jgi:hypothetical protein
MDGHVRRFLHNMDLLIQLALNVALGLQLGQHSIADTA